MPCAPVALPVSRARADPRPARAASGGAAPGGPAAPVTDASVPEGHAGLHSALYDRDASDVHAGGVLYRPVDGEDDGTNLIATDAYVSAREGAKPCGVIALYDDARALQYVGYRWAEGRGAPQAAGGGGGVAQWGVGRLPGQRGGSCVSPRSRLVVSAAQGAAPARAGPRPPGVRMPAGLPTARPHVSPPLIPLTPAAATSCCWPRRCARALGPPRLRMYAPWWLQTRCVRLACVA